MRRRARCSLPALSQFWGSRVAGAVEDAGGWMVRRPEREFSFLDIADRWGKSPFWGEGNRGMLIRKKPKTLNSIGT